MNRSGNQGPGIECTCGCREYRFRSVAFSETSGGDSQRAAEHGLHFFAVAAAESQLRAVAQFDRVVAVKGGLQLLDAFDLNHGGAMDAGETARIELRFEAAERFAQQMIFLADVKLDIVPRGFNPIDLLDGNE